MKPSLTGKVAVVTGGAQGIGRAFSFAFAAAGYRVIVADIDSRKASAVVSELCAAGHDVGAQELDVGDPSSVAAAFDEIVATHGAVDILVNNAALFSTLAVKPFEQLSLEEWNAVLRVNITGVFLCCKAAVPTMRKAGFGRIINIASAAARMGRPNYLHYIASKGAVEAMTRSLARELGPAGVTANTIAPGAIFTEIPRATVTDAQKVAIFSAQCVPRPGAPSDLVSTALHLASNESGFVTGQTFIVDGGVLHG